MPVVEEEKGADHAWSLRLCVCTFARNPTKTETELYLSISCEGKGQQWTATGTGALGAAHLGMA